jgi:sugar lactone lactonase YvrE
MDTALSSTKRLPIGSGPLLLLLVASLALSKGSAAEAMVSTYAGGAVPTVEGGSALQAPVFANGVATDAAGNTYIANSRLHRVQRISSTGIITTVAGTGDAGFSGDGGSATAAHLNLPLGVAVDHLGRIYIADTSNHRIRRVDASGTIATIAGTGVAGFSGDGGPALSAQLQNPGRLVVDGTGAVFVADTSNHRVRRISASGTISTVAGGGTRLGDGSAAGLMLLELYGLALRGSDDVLVVSGNTVIDITLSTAQATIVAGANQFPDLSLPDGQPATSAYLFDPHDVAVTSDGGFVIADTSNYRIRKVDAAGILTTVAGNGNGTEGGDGGPALQASFSYAVGVAFDAAGNLLVASGATLRRIDASQTVTRVAGLGYDNPVQGFAGDGGPAARSSLNAPMGMARDAAGDLFIADSGNNRIRKIDPSGTITTVAGNGVAGFSGDGGPATSASLSGPIGVAVDGSGRLFITDTRNQRIRTVAPDGTISTLAGTGVAGFSGDGGPASAALVNYVWDITVDGAGAVFVADMNNNRVRRIDTAGTITSVAGGGAARTGAAGSVYLGGPKALAFTAAGHLAVANGGDIRLIDLAAGQVSMILDHDATLPNPVGLSAVPGGSLLFVDQTAQSLKSITGSTVLTLCGTGAPGFQDGPASQAGFDFPSAVVAGDAGRIYIADTGNHRIRLLTPGSSGTTTTGGGTTGGGTTTAGTTGSGTTSGGTSAGATSTSGGSTAGTSPASGAGGGSGGGGCGIGGALALTLALAAFLAAGRGRRGHDR